MLGLHRSIIQGRQMSPCIIHECRSMPGSQVSQRQNRHKVLAYGRSFPRWPASRLPYNSSCKRTTVSFSEAASSKLLSQMTESIMGIGSCITDADILLFSTHNCDEVMSTYEYIDFICEYSLSNSCIISSVALWAHSERGYGKCRIQFGVFIPP